MDLLHLDFFRSQAAVAVKAMGTQGESEARAEEIEIATARRGTENCWPSGHQGSNIEEDLTACCFNML